MRLKNGNSMNRLRSSAWPLRSSQVHSNKKFWQLNLPRQFSASGLANATFFVLWYSLLASYRVNRDILLLIKQSCPSRLIMLWLLCLC